MVKTTLRDGVILVASLATLGFGYRWFRRFLADLGGTRAIVDMSQGRVSPWAADERLHRD